MDVSSSHTALMEFFCVIFLAQPGVSQTFFFFCVPVEAHQKHFLCYSALETVPIINGDQFFGKIGGKLRCLSPKPTAVDYL